MMRHFFSVVIATLGSALFALCSYAQTTVTVQNGGKLTVGGSSTVTMSMATGTFSVTGTSSLVLSGASTTAPTAVTRIGSSGTYTVLIDANATLDANNFSFDYLNGEGIRVRTGAKITKFHNGTFSNPTANGVYLNLKDVTSSFTDDFQSNAVGSDPAGWTVVEYVGIDNPNPGDSEALVDVVDGTGIGGSAGDRVVRLQCLGYNTEFISISHALTTSTRGTATVKMRRGETSYVSSFRVSDGTNNFDVTFDAGNIKAGNPSGTQQTIQTFSANTWYTIKIEWNIISGAGDTWSVSIDGTPRVSGWNNGANYGNITSATVRNHNGGGQTTYADDFSHVILSGNGLDGTDRSDIAYTMNNVTFNTSGVANVTNVLAGTKAPVIYFLGNNLFNGNRWGEAYDDDPYDRVRWVTGLVKRTSDSATFDTFTAAISDSGTTTHTLQSTRNIPIDENIVLSKDVIIENAVFAPGSGLAAQSSDTTARGTLRNCVIAIGGVSTVNVVHNGTIFRVDSADAVISVTNSTVTNTLIESGATLTGTTTTTSLYVTSGYFVDPGQMDFHLKAPGGSPDTAAGIDQGTALSFSTDLEGKARPYDEPSVADGASAWDLGAFEYRGVVPTVTTIDLGNTPRIMAGGSRWTGSGATLESVYYVITAGGSSATTYEQKLVVLGATTLNVIATYTVSKPITSMNYYSVSVSGSSTFERRIFLVIDNDDNGTGERIMALVDRGGTDISLDSAWDGAGDPEGDGDGVKPFGNGPIKSLTLLRIDGEADGGETSNPSRGRRMYFVSGGGDGGTSGVLYKINADPQDTAAGANGTVHGGTIWTQSGRSWDYRGVLNYVSTLGDLFVGASGTTSQTICGQITAGGTSTPVIKRYWATVSGTDGAGVDENANGQIVYQNASGTAIYIAPTDGTKVISIAGTSTTGSDEVGTRRFTSTATDGSTLLDTLPFRYFGTNHVIFGAGEKIYKVYDDGDPVSGNDGLRVDGAPGDTDWPKAIKGSVTSRINLWGSYVYWGTKEGYAYASGFVGSNETAGNESIVASYPYLIAPGHRVTEVWIDSAAVYFVTDQGKLVRFTLQ